MNVYIPLERLQYSAARWAGRERSGRGQPGPGQDQARGPTSTCCRRRFSGSLSIEFPGGGLLSGLDLGAEARVRSWPPCRWMQCDPEYPAVLHHRRRRVRHPGHLLDDRRREDPRHRHPQGPRHLVERRSARSSPRATASPSASSAAASPGWREACCSSATSTTSRPC